MIEMIKVIFATGIGLSLALIAPVCILYRASEPQAGIIKIYHYRGNKLIKSEILVNDIVNCKGE